MSQLLYSRAMFEIYMSKSGLRLGQHLCNTFGIKDPEIFYEKNPDIVYDKIKVKYIQQERENGLSKT